MGNSSFLRKVENTSLKKTLRWIRLHSSTVSASFSLLELAVVHESVLNLTHLGTSGHTVYIWESVQVPIILSEGWRMKASEKREKREKRGGEEMKKRWNSHARTNESKMKMTCSNMFTEVAPLCVSVCALVQIYLWGPFWTYKLRGEDILGQFWAGPHFLTHF